MGNYLFCHSCVCMALGVSNQCLSRQRKIKRKLFQQQEVSMAKKDVDEQKLTVFVVMPLKIEVSFNLWWKDVPDDHEVNPTHYFLPKFTTISAPKKNVHNYNSRLATSLVGKFN